jgi:hypothetical protein
MSQILAAPLAEAIVQWAKTPIAATASRARSAAITATVTLSGSRTVAEPRTVAAFSTQRGRYCFGGDSDCGGATCNGLDESWVEGCAGCCAGFGGGAWTGLSAGGENESF